MNTILRAGRIPARTIRSHPGRYGRSRSSAGSLAFALVNVLVIWQDRIRDREALREMNEAQMRDLGISRSEALREANKPFWRA